MFRTSLEPFWLADKDQADLADLLVLVFYVDDVASAEKKSLSIPQAMKSRELVGSPLRADFPFLKLPWNHFSKSTQQQH